MAEDGETKRITSLTNPLVKDIRGLWLGKNRRASGRFIGEGVKIVLDALDAGWPPRQLVTAASADAHVIEAIARGREAGASVVEVSRAILSKITRRDNPQTLVGVFDQRTIDPGSIAPAESDTWIALEGIRDPGNLGTILRTADSAGAAGVILIGDTVDPFSVETVRATMGSIFHVPLARMTADAFPAFAARWPGSIIGTHLKAETDFRGASLAKPQLLLMGTEQAGLTDEAAALCTDLVKIPMAGKADSLNLAVATGIVLFELRRGDLSL